MQIDGKYKQAWLQYYDEVLLTDITDGFELDESRLIEARFTNGTEELHLWKDFSGVHKSETTLANASLGSDMENNVIDNKLAVLDRFGKSLTLREELDFDEDGQVYVKNTIFAGFSAQGGE